MSTSTGIRTTDGAAALPASRVHDRDVGLQGVGVLEAAGTCAPDGDPSQADVASNRRLCGIAGRDPAAGETGSRPSAELWLVGSESSVRPIPGHKRVLAVPRARLRPVLDGALDDEAWKQAAETGQFWNSEQQRWPVEQTTVLVMADAEYLYFGFRIHDRRPEGILALQTKPGAGLGLDDQVAVELDPYLSFREISTYSVNAGGVQSDAIAGGRARQEAWKGEWQSAAARTQYGWSAEIAIPLRMLNFETGATAVGVNFLRYHHRTAEWSRWADITVRALPEEMGRLTDLSFAAGPAAQRWTFMPYFLAGRNVPDKRGKAHDMLFATGGEIRYQPRPNLTGVISLNPDFSQIESAVTSINFNYNEKFRADPRPFFQEGSAYFGSQRSYFYSNRIPNFDIGGKFFTRAKGYQVGALAARGPEDRTDLVVRGEREFDATHSATAMLVTTDQRDFKNGLYAVGIQGREKSGISYSMDAAITNTWKQPGDGARLAGSLGWAADYWSVGLSANRYTRDFHPANGLVDRDLLDTSGAMPYVAYYRDFGDSPLRVVSGDLTYTERRTSDGLVQRRTLYAAASMETRQQVRIGLGILDGVYRPVGTESGSWSATIHHDRYTTVSVDFNTRSSRVGFGGSLSSGVLGGGDYRYASVYGWTRPTRTTFVNVSAEYLSSFGDYRQTVVSAGWDISARHALVSRVIRGDYGAAERLAYSFHARRDLDFFLVYDRTADQAPRVSAKMLMTF